MKSSSSFKSFSTIYAESELFFNNQSNLNQYHAHSHSRKNAETIFEHISLVVDYVLRLIEEHHLEPVIHRLIDPLIKQNDIDKPDEVGNYIKKLFLAAIIFHDFGKINENFQVERMKNMNFQRNRANLIESQHSVLSAFIYISFHLSEINNSNKFNDKIKAMLYVLTYLFATVILKHHSSYLEKEYNFHGELITALHPYLSQLQIDINFELIDNFYSNYEEKIDEIKDSFFSEECHFAIYALIKLCYSLLTGADYYATSEFMLDLRVENFGILCEQEIETFNQNFQNTKSYNKTFFEQREYFQNYPFEQLTDCKNENLNILRQKLLGEVLSEIQQNPDKSIFYLEAPTGAGKTNISLAASLKLLQMHPHLKKIYYVFPFTTLITQTAKFIKEILNVNTEQMIQLHSRSGFPNKRDEIQEGSSYLNYIDYQFVNYPIILLTHVKFFDILKTNEKSSNYIFHRLANSIIIIDELQSYSPREWDKIAYFIKQFAHYFQMKFILMSATLPKLDQLDVIKIPIGFHSLIKNKNNYFQNANFKNRVRFDFSLLEQKIELQQLVSFVYQKSEEYACAHDGKVKTIIEFIFKNTASIFYKEIRDLASEYQIFLLSGTILESRRRKIINFLKTTRKCKHFNKIILVTTQVVEAGVDIDMDIGFKDKSLIDSDEQLAGRVNRNARPEPSKVYIFNLDQTFRIYGNDLRYRITRDLLSDDEYKLILDTKNFDYLYEKVCQHINKENTDECMRNFLDYKTLFKKLQFQKIDREFKIINQQNVTIYVPLPIHVKCFAQEDKRFLSQLGCYQGGKFIDGKELWITYLNIIRAEKTDFVKKQIDIKKIYGIMSQFMFSISLHSNLLKQLLRFCDQDYYENFKILYLNDWEKVYDYEMGINDEHFDEPAFI